jgi:hypothetical protein
MSEREPIKTIRPAFEAPCHIQDPTSSLAGWFTEPAGIVFQVVRRTRFTCDMGRWMAGPAVGALWRAYPDRTDLVLVFDLGLMDGRETEARSILQKAAEENRQRIGRAIIVPPRAANVAYISALQVSATLLKVFGVKVEVERSMTSVLVSCPLRASRPNQSAAG